MDLTAEVGRLVEKHGLGHKRGLILASLRPSIRIRLDTPTVTEGPEPLSRFGGLPWLGESGPWPSADDGRLLTFLGQVSLPELPRIPGRELLPASGCLFFFYDLDRQPWGQGRAEKSQWRVVFLSRPGALPVPAPTGAPTALALCRARFEPDVTAPAFRSIEIDPLDLTDTERDRYGDLLEDVSSLADNGPTLHRVLGHPDAIQGCMQRTVQFKSRDLALHKGVFSWYDHPRAQELIPGALDWRLLLQLDSDDLLGTMWGDGGRLFFWMHRDALAARRFEDTWLFLQCY
jgi:uncharacterized protein DUF1963